MHTSASVTTEPSLFGFSLAEIPRRRRFAAMREMLADQNPPLIRATLAAEREDDEAPFDGSMWLTSSGELSCATHSCGPVIYTRSRRDVAITPIDAYGLFLQVEGVWHLAQGGREQIIEPGGIVLLDSNEPFRSVKRGWCRHHAIRIPRRMADALLPPGWQRTGMVIDHRRGLGSLVAEYARTVGEEVARLPSRSTMDVLDNLCRLLALYAADRPAACETTADALRAARLVRLQHYIEQYIDEPELRPAHVAAEHGMSERSLHLLFAPTGTTFSQHVQLRRLERCRAMLVSAAHVDRSITDIAFACGFNSLATFYRAFQRVFGVAPGELRGRQTRQ
jgi:AraC-like DNA-binding protein